MTDRAELAKFCRDMAQGAHPDNARMLMACADELDRQAATALSAEGGVREATDAMLEAGVKFLRQWEKDAGFIGPGKNLAARFYEAIIAAAPSALSTPPARDDVAALVGWAVSVDDAIDLRTVGPTRRSAIVNWLYVGAMQFIPPSMGDEAIDRLWEQHSARMNAEVEKVSVRAAQSLARVRDGEK